MPGPHASCLNRPVLTTSWEIRWSEDAIMEEESLPNKKAKLRENGVREYELDFWLS